MCGLIIKINFPWIIDTFPCGSISTADLKVLLICEKLLMSIILSDQYEANSTANENNNDGVALQLRSK